MHSFAMVFIPVPLLFTNLQTSGMYHPKAPGAKISGIDWTIQRIPTAIKALDYVQHVNVFSW